MVADDFDLATASGHEDDASGIDHLGDGDPEMFVFHAVNAVAVPGNQAGEFVARQVDVDLHPRRVLRLQSLHHVV